MLTWSRRPSESATSSESERLFSSSIAVATRFTLSVGSPYIAAAPTLPGRASMRIEADDWYTGSMRRTAIAPAASASSTHPRMSQALRAMVAHTRRGSISGVGSARTGRGRASIGRGAERRLVLANQVEDRDQRGGELDDGVGGADRDVVANGERRILDVE